MVSKTSVDKSIQFIIFLINIKEPEAPLSSIVVRRPVIKRH